MSELQPCGTPAAYERHRYYGETPSAYTRARYSERDTRRTRARSRALERLARMHPAEYAALYAEEKARGGADVSAEATIVEVPRDRWQRPLIIPPDGGDPIPYTRVSTLAKVLDDTAALTAWKQRKVAEGLLRRPDLLTRIAGALATGDPDTHWLTKRALDAVCREAREAAAGSKGASAGTGFHALTEAVDAGAEPLWVPDADRARLDAYRAATEGYRALDSETFVVCDELRAAGSLDRLWLCPDGAVRVGDLKTGKSEADYPLATTTQVAIYAHGQRYDPATGARTPLHDEIDQSTGLLIHLPPSGGCQIYRLNLDLGWRAARTAAGVHHVIRAWTPDDLIGRQ